MLSYESHRISWWTYNNTTMRSAGDEHADLFALNLANCSEQATLVLQGGSTYEITHKTASGVWHLVDDKGDVLSTATKPSAWKSTVELEHNGTKLFLSTVRAGRYNCVITNAANETLVSLFKESIFKFKTRMQVAEGDDQLSPTLLAFMYAIFVLHYRRRDQQYAWLFSLGKWARGRALW